MSLPKIKCRWMEDNKYLVNPDGQVFPCCYLSNVYYFSKRIEALDKLDKLPDGHKAEMAQHLLVNYSENEKDNNIFHKNIEEIISGEWFSKVLPESWNDEKTLHVQCRRICGED